MIKGEGPTAAARRRRDAGWPSPWLSEERFRCFADLQKTAEALKRLPHHDESLSSAAGREARPPRLFHNDFLPRGNLFRKREVLAQSVKVADGLKGHGAMLTVDGAVLVDRRDCELFPDFISRVLVRPLRSAGGRGYASGTLTGSRRRDAPVGARDERKDW